MTKIKTLAEEEMDSHKHWTKNLYEIKPGVWVPKNNTRGPLDLEQRIADLTRQVDERDKRIKELDNSLSIALEINDKFQRENKKLTDKVRKAEAMRRPLDTMDEIAYRELEKENGDLRTSIGHRIERVEELNAINREHQMMNRKLRSELEKENADLKYDNKLLAKQVEDKVEEVKALKMKLELLDNKT